MLVGIIGKPSSGKSTFLNAACLTDAKVGDYPFTTIDPNIGTGYVVTRCVCEELNVIDNPINSLCIDHNRYIPIKLLDVAGLVPDAHLGKGLGNKFLSELSRADVLLHILDISGELDLEGNKCENGSHDPYEDIEFLEREINLWFKDILLRTDWRKFANKVAMEKTNLAEALYERLSGLSIQKKHIIKALEQSKLNMEHPDRWTEIDIEHFSKILRIISKPIVIIANKIDKKNSAVNFQKIKNKITSPIIPCSSLAEFYLRKLSEKNLISYRPGASSFKIIDEQKISSNDQSILNDILTKILHLYGSTGIQDALNTAVFDVLDNIVVYPVHDEKKFMDHDGNILPDAYLVPKNMNLKEFIQTKIHSDLAKNFIYALDARTKLRLGENHELKNNDIIKVVSATR
ncbi:MAG: redox-regulated ATPase YchF [Candidatus Lokiarchaeota archaeon]|nr:redox-regulated ATPase YchF [Candidatus Lokiarchaeota archaeon]